MRHFQQSGIFWFVITCVLAGCSGNNQREISSRIEIWQEVIQNKENNCLDSFRDLTVILTEKGITLESDQKAHIDSLRVRIEQITDEMSKIHSAYVGFAIEELLSYKEMKEFVKTREVIAQDLTNISVFDLYQNCANEITQINQEVNLQIKRLEVR